MFAFSPELFECRATAMAVLAEKGFEWLSHYSAVDLLHAEYGLEVAGIPEEPDAQKILEIMKETFPDWIHTRFYYNDFARDRGWKIEIFKMSEEGEQKAF